MNRVFSRAVAGGGRTVAGRDMHSTTQHRSTEHPAIPLRAVCFYFILYDFYFFDLRINLCEGGKKATLIWEQWLCGILFSCFHHPAAMVF